MPFFASFAPPFATFAVKSFLFDTPIPEQARQEESCVSVQSQSPQTKTAVAAIKRGCPILNVASFATLGWGFSLRLLCAPFFAIFPVKSFLFPCRSDTRAQRGRKNLAFVLNLN